MGAIRFYDVKNMILNCCLFVSDSFSNDIYTTLFLLRIS